MPVKIENLTMKPVLLRLNSGKTLHISPRTTSIEIMDVEVKDNTMVQKLQGQCVVALHEMGKKQPPSVSLKKEKSTKGEK